MSITTNFTVSSEGSTTSTDLTSLNGVIRSIDVGGSNAASGANYTITLSGNINLTDGALLALNLPMGSSLTINGGDFTLDGNDQQRGLFVYAGTVDINDLTISHMVAKGGNGASGGGGGAGLGGGLFV